MTRPGRTRGRDYLASDATVTEALATPPSSADGELEFQPRTTGKMFPWVKRCSLIELGIFTGLLIVWLLPGMDGATFAFGLAHGLGFVLLCILIWVAVLRREVPFWLLASALTPVGPVGSSLGVAHIERTEKKQQPATPPPAPATNKPL